MCCHSVDFTTDGSRRRFVLFLSFLEERKKNKKYGKGRQISAFDVFRHDSTVSCQGTETRAGSKLLVFLPVV